MPLDVSPRRAYYDAAMDEVWAAPQLVQLGRLSDKRWPGVLSVRAQLDLPRVMANLNRYYVTVRPGAKTRCIDGRHDPALDERNLGPQVPGGAPGAALAYRLGVDQDDLTRGTFLNDVEVMIDAYMRFGLAPGGHRDDSEHELGVGCGALDGAPIILRHMTSTALVEDHKRLVKTLLSDRFNRDDYLRVLGAGLVLDSRANDYFTGSDGIIDMLEKRAPNSVSELKGVHAESLVCVNFVPNTTLASNRFAHDHGGMQAFGYDIWRSRQLAATLLPLPTQTVDRNRFIMARVMLTIATLMTLTDGSLPLVARLPVEDPSPSGPSARHPLP